MLSLSSLISILLLSNSLEIENNSTELKVMMFTICPRSHLRTMTSIAQELSLKPNVKVTLVISDICEEFIKSQNYNFDIEVVHSAVDKRKPNEQQLADVGEYISEYENDVLEIYIPK